MSCVSTGILRHSPHCAEMIPSGNDSHSCRKSSFSMGQSILSMAIFHSSVCLPEGNPLQPLWKILVNWDDYSQYMGTYKSCSSDHQPVWYSVTNLCHNHQLHMGHTKQQLPAAPQEVAPDLHCFPQVPQASCDLELPAVATACPLSYCRSL